MDSHGHLNVLSGHRNDCQVQKRKMEVHQALGLTSKRFFNKLTCNVEKSGRKNKLP